jgi:predicted DNA-binding transcriptional regulator AlpA
VPRVEMLSMKQAADELGVSRPTLYRWHSLGRGPRVIEHDSGTLKVRRPDLDEYLASRVRSAR